MNLSTVNRVVDLNKDTLLSLANTYLPPGAVAIFNKMPSGAKVPIQEEILQAVVVADSFDLNYRPLTLTKPRVHCANKVPFTSCQYTSDRIHS